MREMKFSTLSYSDGVVWMLDQTKLPQEEIQVEHRTVEEVADSIRDMIVRGAPAIGIAAGYGMLLAARAWSSSRGDFGSWMNDSRELLSKTRPTAVNLFWALDRMSAVAKNVGNLDHGKRVAALEAEALSIHQEDRAMCYHIGVHGAALLEDRMTVMTHCNAGALATGGAGTALALFRVAKEQGKTIRVISNETRPYLQGARLTAWELMKDEIDVTLVADNAAAALIQRGKVDAVVVGTDRTVANGDVANKIGTYAVALAAKASGIPFYVAAPTSTIDLSLQTGDDIEIEERDGQEVRTVFGKPIAPEGVPVMNPAFDVTPNELVTAIITERGVVRAPYEVNLRQIMEVGDE